MGPSATPAPGKSTIRLGISLPFLAFLLGFAAYSAFLQFQLSDALARLFLVRVFFQVAIAALVIATVRNLLGVRTIGTFGPAIIAIAFLATGLPLGLAMLALILGVVMFVRRLVGQERIQETHRVAILVTMVSVTISSIAVLGLEFQQHELFFTVLFPVLISAWIAERYVEQGTRVGWEEPSRALAWTVAAVILSFLVIIQDPLIDFIMLNPLTWPLLVLLNWFLGTRVRFRLSERFRFLGVRKWSLADLPLQGNFQNDVLTMLVRNRDYVARYNPADLLARLGKDEAKALLLSQGVPVARTYMVIRERRDLERFRTWLQDHETFALKPGSGHGGEGILLARGAREGVFTTNMGQLSMAQVESQAAGILEGEYSGGQPDTAVVEELLVQDQTLKSFVPLGLSDIRIISFLGYPVMAMVRIPTQASGGKANIHLGAVAAGVRISTGTLIHSVRRGQAQAYHPDTGQLVLGKSLPFWEETLQVAAEAQRLTGLGFAGVDIVIDANHGPVVMEVNRRPGLEIQNANASGLLRRLRVIESLPKRDLPVEERIDIIKKLDGDNWGLGPAKEQTSPAPEPFSPDQRGSVGVA